MTDKSLQDSRSDILKKALAAKNSKTSQGAKVNTKTPLNVKIKNPVLRAEKTKAPGKGGGR